MNNNPTTFAHTMYNSFSLFLFGMKTGTVFVLHIYDPSSNKRLVVYNYAYGGWNIVKEEVIDFRPPYKYPSMQQSRNWTYYTWGLDQSGTLQGAGGVGGLALVSRDGDNYIPYYDVNGNITEYVNVNSWAYDAVAHYEYDPYGKTVIASSGRSPFGDPIVNDIPFLFSSKYFDEETGLYYYGYRFYSPSQGRWINRDPIEERGGVNLYGFVGNNPIDSVDVLGLREITVNKCEAVLYIGHTNKKNPITWTFAEEGKDKCGIGGAAGCWPSSNNPKDFNLRWPNLPTHDKELCAIFGQDIDTILAGGSDADADLNFPNVIARALSSETKQKIMNTLCNSKNCCEKVTFRYQVGKDHLFSSTIKMYVKEYGFKPGEEKTEEVSCPPKAK